LVTPYDGCKKVNRIQSMGWRGGIAPSRG
jgi:hypothetical protein